MISLANCLLGAPFVADQDHYLLVSFLTGQSQIVPGPAFLRLRASLHRSIEVVAFERFVATEELYVQVIFRDGTLERRMGPCVVTRDPFKHQSLELRTIPRYVADGSQHMHVQLRTGELELRRGPLELVFDPAVHQQITVRDIERYVADPSQYLVVMHRDGRKAHLRGPAELLFDPTVHEQASLHDSHRLSANEAIVVYRRLTPSSATPWEQLERQLDRSSKLPSAAPAADGEHGGVTPVEAGAVHVERRVVRGPAVFMPDANEWLHSFSWHGSVKDGKGSKTGYAGDVKTPHALSFQIIRCMPDQMYYSVRDVRTLDDASLTVHLMLFYELQDIEMMLSGTNDLIGDILNAASADVMTHAAALSYEQFLSRSSELSSLETFPILRARMAQVGTALLKVVYRGYSASAQLQEMHDEAITRRTRIRLESDQAREEQEKCSMQLRCRQERSQQELALEAAEMRHRLEMSAAQKAQERELRDAEHEQQLRFKRADNDEQLRREREAADVAIALQKAEREQEAARFEAMQRLGVDLTRYLTALASSKPDAFLRIEGAGGAEGAVVPNLHLDLPGARGGRPSRH